MLLGALQENLIVLLTYDTERATVIRGIVEPELFGGPYRHIVARIYDYIDRFKKPPGDHLPELLSDKLDGKNKREGELYDDILRSIYSVKDGINPEYAMGQLETFIKRQSYRSVAIDISKALQKDTEESLEEVERIIAGMQRATVSVFDPGTRLSDEKRALKFLDHQDVSFPTGIPELDKRGFGPVRKELWVLVGNTKAGKSWALIHLAKMALLHRYKVLHVSLEMSEERCAQRYFQTLFAMSKRNEAFKATKFETDDLGRITDFQSVAMQPSLTMDDPDIRKKLQQRIAQFGTRLLDNIIIKDFPSGSLTLPQLEAYLDMLEAREGFVPDLIELDYPDLMKMPAGQERRLALDDIYIGFRGLLKRRNCAGAVVSQSHRAGAKAKQLGADNIAEAYSKVMHSDCTITYTSTPRERSLGLARLHVAAGRNDQDKITIVISQQYGMGNFAVDSVLMRGNYWDNLPRGEDGDDEE